MRHINFSFQKNMTFSPVSVRVSGQVSVRASIQAFIMTVALLWAVMIAAANSAIAKGLADNGTENGSKAAAVQQLDILAIGDSLTAGYGLGPGEGFTDQLEDWLNKKSQHDIDVMNAGVSGDTSSGGRSRLDWALAPYGAKGPDLVIVELGANDGLRGVDPTITRDNIDQMVKTLTQRNIPVLIAGMMAPPNLGPQYAAIFNPIFSDAAQKYNVPLYPFFLEGVAAVPDLNQEDGIHPTKEGVALIVSKIGPQILDILPQ